MELANWTSVVASDANVAAEMLNKKSVRRCIDKGAFLIHQGEAIDHVYLVTSGLFEALNIQVDGAEVWLADLEPGEVVGEVSALHSHESSSSVISRASSEVLAVSRNDFISALDSNGQFARAIASLLAERIAKTSQNLSDKASKSVLNRLLFYLDALAVIEKETGTKRVIAPPPITAISERIHATREATSRAMTKLQLAKRVTRSNGEIIIKGEYDAFPR